MEVVPWSAISHRRELSAKSASFSSGLTPTTLKPSEKYEISSSICNSKIQKKKEKKKGKREAIWKG